MSEREPLKNSPRWNGITDSIRSHLRQSGVWNTRTLVRQSRPTWRDVFQPKILSVLDRNYWRECLAKDLMAGVIVGIVALPLAIAFAVASGVAPEKGLITAIAAGFLVSLLGGSRVQIGGPTGAFIVIVYGVLAEYGLSGLAVSTMLAGLFLVGFGLLRLGNVIKLIPHTVITGFTSGIAVTIFSTQIKDALGLELESVPEHFIPKWSLYLASLGAAHAWSLLITLGSIAVILLGLRLFPRIPGSLIAIVLSATAVAAFSLPVETIGDRFGALPSGFQPAWPTASLAELPGYFQPAFTIALLCAIESLLSAVVADGMIGDAHNSNTELIAQGAANLIVPLLGGIPATGAIARTITNVKSGGATPVAGIVHAATLLAIAMSLGKYAQLIPMPCLAGILIVVSYNMSEWRTFISFLKAPIREVAVLLATFLLTVLVDLTVAIEVGMLLASFLFIQRMSEMGTVFSASVADPAGGAEKGGITVPADRETRSRVDVFEISGPFFFAAAREYQQVLQSLGTGARAVIIRMRHVPFVDETGIRTFRDTIRFLLNSRRVVALSGVRPNVRDDFRRHGIIALLGEDRVFANFDAAMEFVNSLPDIGSGASQAIRPGKPDGQ
ncbi:MAG: STAS domain-containing protein [Planctomycetota bacterium]|jgi:SulP family sulfate permease|nr:STAS domain-containing protein [Planctomycetota bacterium]